MKKKMGGVSTKSLVIIFVILIILIITLIVGVVLMQIFPANQGEEIEEVEQAINVDDKIYNLLNNSDYTIDDAIDTYEKEMVNGSPEKKLRVAIFYANFILDNKNDFTEAKSIMDRVEYLTDNKQFKVFYYEALRDLCLKASEECAEDYDNILTQIIDEASENNSGEMSNE